MKSTCTCITKHNGYITIYNENKSNRNRVLILLNTLNILYEIQLNDVIILFKVAI